MRLPRRTSLLVVALSLFTSAPTASREGAWVLWMKTENDPGEIVRGLGIRWTVIGGYDTVTDCEGYKVDAFTRDEMAITRDNLGTWVRVRSTYRFTCFPDTVDPRGTKRK